MVAGGRLDACPNFNIIGSARAAYSRPFAPAAALLFTALLFEETDSMSDIDMTGVDIIVVGAGNAATCAALSAVEHGAVSPICAIGPIGTGRLSLAVS